MLRRRRGRRGPAATVATIILCFPGAILSGAKGRAALQAQDQPFLRGDLNQNASLDLGDAVRTFGFLFLGDRVPPCLDAVDSNDTGTVDVSDGIYTLSYLFSGGAAPPPPYPEVGGDPTGDALDCAGGEDCRTWTNSVGMVFVYIPAGSFLMGAPDEERGRSWKEGPVHKVNISRSFYLAATEVTQAQYEAVVGVNPSYFNGGEHGSDTTRPVEQVNWEDTQEFCRLLSALEGKKYRLPTEAEWEYACRAGTTTRFPFGDALECDDGCGACALAERGLWWCGNNVAQPGTKPVGQTTPNPWCLSDMNGNVWEWCQDWAGRYPEGEVTDPTGGPPGIEKMLRGGHFGLELHFCRSAMRGDLSTEHRFEFLGFRVLLEEADPGS